MNFDKFKFLIDYFELVVFRLRSSYFYEKIKNRVNQNITTSIRVSRSNILVDSYEQLHKLSPDQLLHKYSVCFIGENGIDAGGLTKEWFTLVVNELFNPNYALFAQTNNQSYQPGSTSYLNPDHIKYFKFAGSLIARALVGGQCV